MKTNLLMSWRSLKKNSGFSIINIAGLAIGMATFLFIIHYVRFERSYEDFHLNADNIYRITLDLYKGSEYVATDCETHAPLAPALKREMTEVLDYTRFYAVDETPELTVGNHRVTSDKIFYADQSVFDVFTLKVVDGVSQDALTEPFRAVITSTLARAVFGTERAAGKSFELYDNMFTVNAVVEDLPPNTHLKMKLLLSHSTLPKVRDEYSEIDNWRGNNEYTYTLMVPGTDLVTFNQKLHDFSNKLKDKLGEDRYSAETIKSIHLYSNKTYEPEANGNAKVVSFLGIIAGFIIAMAWINYVNLATARSVERAREVGMRKVMGSMKWQLIAQFLLEATILNVVGATLAFLLFVIGLPFFRDLSGQLLPTDVHLDLTVWLLLGGLVLVGTLSSGLYPSFVLSSFRPVQVLKGKFQSSAHGQLLRKGLVVLQFGVTFLLTAGLLIVYTQITHLRKVDLGMSVDQVVAIPAPRFTGVDSSYLAGIDKFKTDLLAQPFVSSVGGSGSLPGFDYNRLASTSFARMGVQSDGRYEYYFHTVDGDYFKTMGIQLIEGRNFVNGASNQDQAILNETAIKKLGFSSAQEAIGQRIGFYTRWPGEPSEVIGVVADYYQRSPKESVIPMAYRYSQWPSFITVQVKTTETAAAMTSLREIFLANYPTDTFEGFFMDEMYNLQYVSDRQFGRVITSASLLAVFIACLGLFGLSAYTITQRTKEIGIRKVLGASVTSIVTLLTGGFVRLVLLSGLVAVPVTYFAMREWLSNYANRIDLSPSLFLIPILIILVVALVTVSSQTLRSARANPTDSLRQE